jgi:DNA polymerase-3 subunit alpha
MLNWCPLRNYTHYSLLKGFSKPDELAQKCKEEGYPACGLADYKTISGAVRFYKACKKAGIKPIIGCSFDDFTLFAKNKDGWFDLIKIVSSLDENENVPSDVLNKVLKKNNIIRVSNNCKLFPISYYVHSEDAKLHRVLLCSELKTTLPKVHKQIHKGELSKELEYQFTHDDLCLWSKSTFEKALSEASKKDAEYINTIIDSCEEYDILSKPMLPAFPCPNGETEEDYLKELCRVGWKNLLIDGDKVSKPEDKEKYLERFKEEFDVIKGANLFGYFLIVQDIIQYVNDQGWLSGPGRGCFLPDTRVKMSNGLMKNICDIQINDKIIDCNGNAETVYDTLVYDIDEDILELWFGDIVIRCTKDHKFLTTNRGWVEAQYLTESDNVCEI